MDESINTPFTAIFPTSQAFRQTLAVATSCVSDPAGSNQSQNLRFLTIASTVGSTQVTRAATPRYDGWYLPRQVGSYMPNIEGISSDGGQNKIVPHHSSQDSCPCENYRPFPLGTQPQRPRLRLTQPSELPGCCHYVALSYCWQHGKSTSKPDEHGQHYTIDTIAGPRRNRVATEVLDRVIEYAAERCFKLIWIDQECIEQDDEDDKQRHISVMDKIYCQSQLVAALLTNPIMEQDHIDLLMALEQDPMRHSNSSKPLIDLILSDRWYARAWTFHEALSASRSVHLLIPCKLPPNRPHFLGNMSRQVVVPQKVVKYIIDHYVSDIQCIDHNKDLLNISTITLVTGQELSAHAVCKQLLRRGIQLPWDLLEIVANICHYGVRINKNLASNSGLQIGPCLFALALMNGDLSLLRAANMDFSPEEGTELAFSWCPIPWLSFQGIVQTKFEERPEEYACRLEPRSLRHQRNILSSQGLLCCGTLFPLPSYHASDLFFPDQPALFRGSSCAKYYWRVRAGSSSSSDSNTLGTEDNPIKLTLVSPKVESGLSPISVSEHKFYLLV